MEQSRGGGGGVALTVPPPPPPPPFRPSPSPRELCGALIISLRARLPCANT